MRKTVLCSGLFLATVSIIRLQELPQIIPHNSKGITLNKYKHISIESFSGNNISPFLSILEWQRDKHSGIVKHETINILKDQIEEKTLRN